MVQPCGETAIFFFINAVQNRAMRFSWNMKLYTHGGCFGRQNCKNWCFVVKRKLEDLKINGLANKVGHLAMKMYVDAVQDALSKTGKIWLNVID